MMMMVMMLAMIIVVRIIFVGLTKKRPELEDGEAVHMGMTSTHIFNVRLKKFRCTTKISSPKMVGTVWITVVFCF